MLFLKPHVDPKTVCRLFSFFSVRHFIFPCRLQRVILQPPDCINREYCVVKTICIHLIRLYQLFLSPLFPRTCRFTPTCSHYAIAALQRHGLGRGLWLTLRRLLRCHPFGGEGYDPVE